MTRERPNIVLIEDDVSLAHLTETYLEQNSITVSSFDSIEKALKRRLEAPADLIVCDVMLPGVSGFQGLKLLVRHFECPVLFLTARTDDDDQITGLELGACDYITKPVAPSVLLAKIKANLRKSSYHPHHAFSVGELTLNPATHEFSVGDIHCRLTTKDFALMQLFAMNFGQTLSREYLFETYLGRPYNGLDRAIDLKISRLRKRLQSTAEGIIDIVTVHGEGYRLCIGSN